LHFFVITFIR